jgi:hypothetical protein
MAASAGYTLTVVPKPDTAISISAISGVTPPVRGAAPVTVITETAQYTGTVKWYEAGVGEFTGSTFGESKEYFAEITLNAKDGFRFLGVAANFFTLEGASSVIHAADSNVVIAQFPATGSGNNSGGSNNTSNNSGRRHSSQPAQAERGTIITESETPLEDMPNPFTDVAENIWYHDAVVYVFEKGIMLGTADDRFSPDMSLTRGMIVTILYRLAGEPDVTGMENGFTDVPLNTWYTSAVIWAAGNGIVTGYGDGRFGPNDPVTMEQLAALIYRTQQADGKIPADTLMDYEWPDFDSVSNYAKGAVSVLTIQGTFGDIPGENFSPQTPATRAVVASVLFKYLTAVE